MVRRIEKHNPTVTRDLQTRPTRWLPSKEAISGNGEARGRSQKLALQESSERFRAGRSIAGTWTRNTKRVQTKRGPEARSVHFRVHGIVRGLIPIAERYLKQRCTVASNDQNRWCEGSANYIEVLSNYEFHYSLLQALRQSRVYTLRQDARGSKREGQRRRERES